MSKKTVKRLLATVLSFTMMWGMCLSVSAAGGATSCSSADQEVDDYQEAGTEYCIMDLADVDDINSLPAGKYLDDGDESLCDAEVAAYNAFAENYSNCQNESKEESFGDSCGCERKYDAWVAAVNALEEAIKVSDGSNYVAPSELSGPCGGSVAPETSAAPSEPTVEEVVKTPENEHNRIMETTITYVNNALSLINHAMAAGNSAMAEAIRAEGVTVDTGVWYSFNLNVYEQIEKAGIPVTLIFRYEGLTCKVTIPAGAKVTLLCDRNGWCGFLNLAAHYGFEIL